MKDFVFTASKEESINDLMISLAEVQSQQRQLINNISHELRTPLTLVYGYIQSIYRHSHNLTQQQKDALDIAIFEMRNTMQILQDSLDLARLDSQAISLQLEPVLLNDLILDVIKTFRKNETREIVFQEWEINILALADVDRLRQVLLILIDNAVKYSDASITIQLTQQDDWISIGVCDQGCGISVSDQLHIFSPFYRVDHSRNRLTGGVGMGLAIVKVLVERMEGAITVHSQLSKGSIFEIMLKSPMIL